MDPKNIFVIEETSEKESRLNTRNLSIKAKEEIFWKGEYDKINKELENCKTIIIGLREENDREKIELTEQLTAEVRQKFENEIKTRIRSQRVILTIYTEVVFNLTRAKIPDFLLTPQSNYINKDSDFGTNRSRNFESYRFQVLEQENQRLKEQLGFIENENNELKNQNIELSQEIYQLKQENGEILEAIKQNRAGLNESKAIYINSEENYKIGNEIVNNPTYIYDKNQDELEKTKERNQDLIHKLENIRNEEQRLNFIYQKEIVQLSESSKALYELYLKKQNFLMNKENQMIAIHKKLKEEFEDHCISTNKIDYFVVFLVLFVILVLFWLYYYTKVLKMQIF